MPRLLDELSHAALREVFTHQLNVTGTHAKRVLYGVGSQTERQPAGMFSIAAEMLRTRSAPQWLRDQMAPAL